MSRLVELLHKLHKSPTPLGFGFAPAASAAKRMLVIARVEGVPGSDVTAGVSKSADAVALVCSSVDEALRPDSMAVACSMPVGMWLDVGEEAPARSGDAGWDFVVCGPDGPVEALAWKDSACLVRVTAGVEGSRLRAIADLGADAVVLSSEGLELDRISAVVECRRVRLMSGRPVLLHIVSALTPLQVAVLWRAGVDAIIVDAAGDCKPLAAARAAAETAPYDLRNGEGKGSATIGAHLAHPEEAPVEEKEGGEEEEEEEPDEDE